MMVPSQKHGMPLPENICDSVSSPTASSQVVFLARLPPGCFLHNGLPGHLVPPCRMSPVHAFTLARYPCNKQYAVGGRNLIDCFGRRYLRELNSHGQLWCFCLWHCGHGVFCKLIIS